MTAGTHIDKLSKTSAHCTQIRQTLPESAESMPFVSNLDPDEVGPDVITSSENEESDDEPLGENESGGEENGKE